MTSVPPSNSNSTAPPAAVVPATATTDAAAVDPNLPPSKSALKRAEKEAATLARKALKNPIAVKAAGTAAKPKKEKPVVKVVEEEAFVEVPAGHKKHFHKEMASGYNPIDVEKSVYAWWKQFFPPAIPADDPTEYSFFDPTPRTIPRGSTAEEYAAGKFDASNTVVIPVPPPNVTGSLHIGHALAFALQDTLIRWYRMKGFRVLLHPGFDHAGISTQSVVEKRLMKDQKLTRHDVGREEFLKKCYTWKDEYQMRITNQIQRLGVSCDWDRVAFTMDENLTRAVSETFVRLHDEGIIYRANRLVNWCVQMNTTLSNLEVDQKVLAGRTMLTVPGYGPTERFEFGVITSFSYHIEGSDEKITIATTRPETMLGDTAIAVHPADPRYTHLHGKFALHPFLGRRIPIICDEKAVDMEFGTGAVKITPAHDPNDYAVGIAHKLEFINILNDDGTLNANAGPEFQGMKRFHARNAVIAKLKEMGLYVGFENNPMSIPVCSKSGDIIESVMKPQWWISVEPLAKAAKERTDSGEIKISPESSKKEWDNWMSNPQDWCISRQLWWGHRAPAYFVTIAGKEQDRLSGEFWVSGRNVEEAQARAEAKFPGVTFTLEQDEDVLDTWFSSGLFPFSIQGWPEQTNDLKAFYPSTILETGWDILFFWVARMVMLGVHLTGQVPFTEVFCHAMIRDAHGRKMSKSLGNVIDPIDVIEGTTLEALHAQLRAGNMPEKEVELAEKGQKKDFPNGIPQCGTDALRFALCNYSSGGRDINLEILRVEGYRKFCNKLWNATKFAMGKFGDDYVPPISEKPSGKESLAEKWILQKLDQTTASVNKALEERNFLNATADVYAFWLYEVCDVYIEAIKLTTDPEAPAEARLSAQNTLYTVLDNGLRLLHPFMPFVTEELWQRLPRRPTDKTRTIMLARFPAPSPTREFVQEEKDYNLAISGVKAIRSMATGYGLNTKLQVVFQPRNATLAATLRESTETISVLIKGCTSFVIVDSEEEVPEGCVSTNVSSDLAVHLVLKGVIDIDVEINKSEKKLAFAKLGLEKLAKTMQSESYVKKPEENKAKDAEKVRDLDVEIVALSAAIEGLLKLK